MELREAQPIMTDKMQPFTTSLWFDDQAEEAVEFYTSLFHKSIINHVAHYSHAAAEASGQPEGSVMTIAFELEGQPFLALNGGSYFKFSPAISLFVVCEAVEEIDALWSKLKEDGFVMMELGTYDWSEKYGWLQDKFGLSWQIMLGRKEDVEQKITPSLLFVGEQHGRAEEAIYFYTSIFKPSHITGISHYGAGEANPQGTVKHAQFVLNGNVFMAMESAHEHPFSFSGAISFIVNCNTQEEIDYYWDRLSAHPDSEQCGWLKDKFGVSWQIVPKQLGELMSGPDPEKAQRVMQAMLQMKKIDLAKLMQA